VRIQTVNFYRERNVFCINYSIIIKVTCLASLLRGTFPNVLWSRLLIHRYFQWIIRIIIHIVMGYDRPDRVSIYAFVLLFVNVIMIDIVFPVIIRRPFSPEIRITRYEIMYKYFNNIHNNILRKIYIKQFKIILCCINILIVTNIYIYTHTHTHTHTHTPIYTHTHIYIYLFIYLNLFTHCTNNNKFFYVKCNDVVLI